MNDTKLDENVYWMLVQVAVRAKHGLMKLAETHDLTVIQMQTLGMMQPGTPIPMNNVSCFLGCDASNVTGIVDRLLAQGYIQRQENPQDRRVKMISLTENGIVLRTKLLTTLDDYELPEFKRLDSLQLAQLKSILAVLLEAPVTNR